MNTLLTVKFVGEKVNQYLIKANAAGLFKSEIAPVEIKTRKGVEHFEVDEHPRPQTDLAALTKLKPVFIKDTGLVTAG